MTNNNENPFKNFENMFDFSKLNMNALDITKIEWPAPLKEAAEKSIAQAKDAMKQVKVAQEEATKEFEANVKSATATANQWNQKTLDVARANASSAFDYFEKLMASKSVAEAVELQTSYIRAQAENLNTQAKELSEMAKKVASETQENIKTQGEKAMSKLKK